MKIEITVDRSDWAYRVRIARAATGHLYAHLVGAEGKVGAILSTRITSLDAIVNDAPALYAELLKRFGDTFQNPTTNTQPPCLPSPKKNSPSAHSSSASTKPTAISNIRATRKKTSASPS